MSIATQSPTEFFFDHASGAWDPATETEQQGRKRQARQLASDERWAVANGLVFLWTDDFLVDHEAEFGYVPATCEECTVLDAVGKVLGTLGCVDDADQEYRRVIEAELASEVRATMGEGVR